MEIPRITTISNPALLGLDALQAWDTELAFIHLQAMGVAETKRTAERRLNTLGINPQALTEGRLLDEHGRPPGNLLITWAIDQARKRRDKLLFSQLSPLPGGRPCLHANDARGARFWVPLPDLERGTIESAIHALQQHIGKRIALFPHGALVGQLRGMVDTASIRVCHHAYRADPSNVLPNHAKQRLKLTPTAHLKRLENESIHILREIIAEAQHPVMLHSMGKNSCVMLHLARKAFYPAAVPFKLLHIDTQWEFEETYLFRDYLAREFDMKLLVHTNQDVIDQNINPFDHDPATYRDVAETTALKQALDRQNFDLALFGCRREKKMSHTKEGVFSLGPRNYRRHSESRRTGCWQLHNMRKNSGECIRAFPIENWTELDIWQYIFQENILIPPLYFAKIRPVVARPEITIPVDDDRCRLLANEEIRLEKVRFDTLDCYPLSNAEKSDAETVEDILLQKINDRQTGKLRQKTKVNSADLMKKKTQKGYF